MKRVGDAWVEITWDQALAEIAAKVNDIRARHGNNAVAGYLGNPAAFGALHPMAFHGFLLGLGTTNVYSSASQDLTNKYLVAQRMYGVPLLQPIPDIDRAGLRDAARHQPADQPDERGAGPQGHPAPQGGRRSAVAAWCT